MALLTEARAIGSAPYQSRTIRLAEAEFRREASAPPNQLFDVFLSHSSLDARVIAGVKAMLEADGVSVYVDWIVDAQLDRTRVTAATADTLRRRMRNSRYLLYACSSHSTNSKWMPWELGYFDGHRPGKVGILPIVRDASHEFASLEFLSLYPTIELLRFTADSSIHFARSTSSTTGETVRAMATA